MLWNNPIPDRQNGIPAASPHRESAELHTFLNPKERLAASYIVTMKTRHALSSRPVLFLADSSVDSPQGVATARAKVTTAHKAVATAAPTPNL
jgi:hypothetical protein